ncbi:alpha/beta hydrolase [Olivibacter sitiensis]|uniref:alpha/beta hydrolase n=1 Tax=Olivibacter sitiensis TaxID=376470 RepID=UPI0004133931|nr:dienelactone hydrolase family protein [Olivibacter sitiensis]
MYSHKKQIFTAGSNPQEAKKALVMIHGRGASAQDIIGLGRYLHLDDFALYVPQASNSSWYPYSFMAPEEQNQPALDSALALIDELVGDIVANSIDTKHIYFLGFSQGACLSLEYVARHAKPYGGVMAFTGGLIGKELVKERYQGDFAGCPILISTGNPDPHVPLSRVEESVDVLRDLGAKITLKVYPGRPHTIGREELDLANSLILGN